MNDGNIVQQFSPALGFLSYLHVYVFSVLKHFTYFSLKFLYEYFICVGLSRTNDSSGVLGKGKGLGGLFDFFIPVKLFCSYSELQFL